MDIGTRLIGEMADVDWTKNFYVLRMSEDGGEGRSQLFGVGEETFKLTFCDYTGYAWTLEPG